MWGGGRLTRRRVVERFEAARRMMDGNQAGWLAAVETRQRLSANQPLAATRRKLDDMRSTACVGLGTRSFPVCLPYSSRSASR